jgi:Flp pilus assembly protein TadD
LEQEDAAIELLTAVLNEEQPYADALAQLARLRLDAGDHAEAARLYEIGTKHFPLEDRYWSGLGIALWRAGDDSRLRPVLEYLVGREYDNAGIRKKLAEIASAEERYEDAVRWGREALFIDVTDVEVHTLLAKAYQKLEQPAKARREWQAVLALAPENGEAKGALESLGE